jgi:hypothetical protein
MSMDIRVDDSNYPGVVIPSEFSRLYLKAKCRLRRWFAPLWETALRLSRGPIPEELVRAVRQYKQRPIYSAVDLGPLGYLGDLGEVEAGEGRWQWLLKKQTQWKNKRVLDLGSNNCLYALRMLQLGAEEVHCVEINPEYCEEAILLRKIIEFLDGRKLNFHLHNRDMLDFLTASVIDDESFDIVMALCSIYYVGRREIPSALAIIARIGKECWLQANVGTIRQDKDRQVLAGVEFLAEQLHAAGFDHVQVIAPRNYSRPLLIGRKRKSLVSDPGCTS